MRWVPPHTPGFQTRIRENMDQDVCAIGARFGMAFDKPGNRIKISQETGMAECLILERTQLIERALGS